MKIYISVDIEGITGVTSWSETELNHPDHCAAAIQMTNETKAACNAALAAGFDEIWVKDAHDSARNLIIENLPDQVRTIRGWTNTPESMMAGIDGSFDAAAFIGYHSGAGFCGNPLAHTMNRANNYFKINGEKISEFHMNAYIAAHYGVPVVFVSGDEQLCLQAKKLIPSIETVAVKSGLGNATFNMSPDAACQSITIGLKKALANPKACKLQSPDTFEMEINFKDFTSALRASYYPGVRRIDEHTVSFTAKDIQEMMTARMFIM